MLNTQMKKEAPSHAERFPSTYSKKVKEKFLLPGDSDFCLVVDMLLKNKQIKT